MANNFNLVLFRLIFAIPGKGWHERVDLWHYHTLLTPPALPPTPHLAVQFGHLERVQGLGVTHVDPHGLVFVLQEWFFVLNLFSTIKNTLSMCLTWQNQGTVFHLTELVVNFDSALRSEKCSAEYHDSHCSEHSTYVTGQVSGCFGRFDGQGVDSNITWLGFGLLPILLVFYLFKKDIACKEKGKYQNFSRNTTLQWCVLQSSSVQDWFKQARLNIMGLMTHILPSLDRGLH